MNKINMNDGRIFLAAIIAVLVSLQVTSRANAGQRLRVATYNASLARSSAGQLASQLSSPGNTDINQVAEVIQYINPDVILINEFDYDGTGQSAADFQTNYLSIGQNGLNPVTYGHVFNAPSNTGIQPETVHGPLADFDFNNSGGTNEPNDAFGFGNYEGQFGMLLLSKQPIDTGSARTFQEFLWKDMPGALLPKDPNDADSNADLDNWYTSDERDVFRLSSKSHWDVPVTVDGETVHLLASHPTPPVFDDGTIDTLAEYMNPTVADWNGLRNHDEIRFWADYVTPGAGNDYIYDDDAGMGGLDDSSSSSTFIILGDQNADENEGDSSIMAAQQLVSNPNINASVVPTGKGGDDPDDTSTFDLRVDYVLPSNDLTIEDTSSPVTTNTEKTAVFWPEFSESHPHFTASLTSDHRLVYVDLIVGTLGDLDNDDDVDAADIDQMFKSFSETNLNKFDLDEDGVVDADDVAYIVETILGTSFGDATLDGNVDFDDFLALQGSFGQMGGWADGDFTGDMVVDFDDFLQLQGNFQNAPVVAGAGAFTAVPEPATWFILGIAGLTFLLRPFWLKRISFR